MLTALGNIHAQKKKTEKEIRELEAFIAREISVEESNSLLPTERSVDSLMFSEMDPIEIPRSLSVISPEAMDQYGINDVNDLTYAVPGATVVNFFGVPGIPTTRGLFTSVYFNGMKRVWNRNGYPTSFGSLEAMDYVKGPVPANYSAASPGGFVNFIPKSPYFDEQRGSLKVKVGSYEKYFTQLDMGGPFLLGNKPSAYRVSFSAQDAGSYYDGIKNDYQSLYASLKTRISDRVSLFIGGEFYRYRGKENPGWNRVTQDLIDRGQYITGNPVNDLTGDSFSATIGGEAVTFNNDTPGFVNRAALETATPFGGTRGEFDGSFLASTGFEDAGFRIGDFNPESRQFFEQLGAIDNPGSGVQTVKIEGNTVLTNPDDFSNADTYLFFFDTDIRVSDNLKIVNKFFIDGYEREKRSSYGYAEYGKNFTLENKLFAEQSFSFLRGAQAQYGISVRYEDAVAKTDFTVEPFNRRDITQPVTPNTVLKAGSQRDDTDNTPFWDPFGSWDTQMTTYGIFATSKVHLSERFQLFLSARADHATWDRAVPFGLGADFNSGEKPGGGKTYANWSISPSLKLSPNTSLYYTYQLGTSFQGYFVSGSVDRGDSNFQQSRLHEVGLRNSALSGRLYTALTYFYQDLEDFDQRGGAAFEQRGYGVEFESVLQANENLTFTANATYQRHYYRTDTIPGGFVPLSPEEITRFAGIFHADFGGRPNPGGPRYGIPEWTFSLFARYDFDNGFGISGGPHFVDSVFGNPDKTLTLPSYTLLNGSIYYRTEKWDVSLSGKNLLNTDYFHPMSPFAANTIILKGEPTTAELALTIRF